MVIDREGGRGREGGEREIDSQDRYIAPSRFVVVDRLGGRDGWRERGREREGGRDK